MRRSPTATRVGDGPRWSRCGYTLLEVLIASVLIATLMVAAWGLMSMCSSFLIAGRNQAAEQQLSRSLMDLVSTDLRASAPLRIPPSGLPAEPFVNDGASVGVSSSSHHVANASDQDLPAMDVAAIGQELPTAIDPLPEMTFSGDEHSLTLIGVRREPQVDPRRLRGDGGSLMPTGDFDEAGFGTLPVDSTAGLAPEYAMAPEWTKIMYRFVPPQAVSGDDRELLPGLHRFEIPVEFLSLLAHESSSGGASESALAGSGAETTDELTVEFADSVQLLLDQQVPGVTHEHVPEVVACRFEYFAGSTWRRQWSTSPAVGRPLAVRVSVRLLSTNESRQLSALLGMEDIQGQPLEHSAVVEPTNEIGGSGDPFEAFDPRLYRRTILTEPDRGAVRPLDETTPGVADGIVSSRQPPGGE